MILEAQNVSLDYTEGANVTRALNDINLAFDYVGYYGIIGPSGSGKSSLLYLLSGIRKPTSGKIFYCGYSYPESQIDKDRLRRQEMGFMFQSPFLIKYLTARENILVGADETAGNSEWIDYIIEFLGLKGLQHKLPEEMSGGQRQRVSLARALANKPKLLFVDEPTAHLDHETGKKVVSLLQTVSEHACVITVTHDETILNHVSGILHIWDGKLK
ncbi:MAG: hypothetical protein OHK0017_02020 [Patescibacteria group bacterium]